VVDHVKIFRNIPAIKFTGRIHEQIISSIRRLGGDVCWTDCSIIHAGADNSSAGRMRKHKRDMRLLQIELLESPDSTFTLFNIGMTLIDGKEYEAALKYLSRSLQVAVPGESHIPKIFSYLVQAYCGLGRVETAMKTCRQGLAISHHDPELLFRLGGMSQDCGNFEEAERCFKSVLELPRQHRYASFDHGILGIKTLHNLALLYATTGRTKESASTWKRVILQSPGIRAAWWGLLGACVRGNFPDDISGLIDLLPNSNGFSEIRNVVGVWLKKVEKYDMSALQQAGIPQASELSGEALEVLSLIAFKNNRQQDCVPWLSEMCRRNSRDGAAFHNLAVAHLCGHNASEAIACGIKSLKVRPGNSPTLALLEFAKNELLSKKALADSQVEE
jgi:tetratricopeptide (TPR) repeat protein